jgi:hypothetical protein
MVLQMGGPNSCMVKPAFFSSHPWDRQKFPHLVAVLLEQVLLT